MVRIQIQLTEQQLRKLRARARERGISLAEMIRRCIDFAFADETNDRAELYEKAARIVGRFPDEGGAKDLAREHDCYIENAFESS
jgi:hypothetical protein